MWKRGFFLGRLHGQVVGTSYKRHYVFLLEPEEALKKMWCG